ncbi:MAG: ABC transporter ATP-binding protein [Candidatus Marsarchaeota archaeon]|nr:ABC transporter ATP-binding protein [Candidatus Marsarchaeota archaeon]
MFAMDLAVEVDRVSKVYPGGKRALNEFTLDAEAEAVLGLLGKNGAGKTTLTRILSTILKPSSGYVEILGMDLEKQISQIRRKIAVVPQEGRPYGLQTPYEHILMYLVARGWDLSSAKKRAAYIIEEFDLEDYRDVICTALSGGLKQRVMIAMAVAADPDLLLLDEPTIGLDPLARIKIWDVVRKLVDKGTTIFLTTHYMDEAEVLSKKVVLVDNGRKVAEGAPEELKRLTHASTTVILNGNLGGLRLHEYGKVIGNSASTRVLTDEQGGRDLVEKVFDRGVTATLRPVNLEDVFILLVGESDVE